MSGDLDTTAYRTALGLFATGVVVVTATTNVGTPVGMTMNSFNSVSLDPPLVLFSIDQSALSLDAFRSAQGYAINVLGGDQEELCLRFAKPQADKWKNIVTRPGEGGAPLIEDAIAYFECVPWATYDGGDHVIFVCRVIRFNQGRDDGALVCFNGRFQALSRDT
ncbi:MAG: flavin reductase family protein [Rhodospirillales bacterium]|jgi:flavin reductase (DIM6/NTAB) family NADH-FMN oxidoreductase RutF